MKRFALLTLVLVPSLAAADHVTVKGTVLEGKVKSVSAKQVVMETVYGKGDLVIATSDVTAIETDAPFHVYQADDGVAVGPVVGITPAAVTVTEGGAPKDIAFENVQAAPRDAGPDANWFQRRPVESPWWSGHADASYSSTNGTTNTSAMAFGVGLLRERGPSRTKLEASYMRSTSQAKFETDDSRHVTVAELRGLARQEYDATAHLFGFGSMEAENDGVERLSYRLIPKLGAGYKLANTETYYLGADAGVSYVYERFHDNSINNYAALALGAEQNWKLPWLGSVWHTRVDYLPAFSDPFDDYRLRGETSLVIPIYEQLALKTSLVDDYNPLPAPDTSRNSLTSLIGLSLIY